MTDMPIDIGAELAARVDTIRAVTEPSDADTDCEYCGYLDLDAGTHDDEAHQDAEAALPLSVEEERWARIDLSTGGPGDWLMVRRAPDGYNPPERIVYHYVTWGTHDSIEVEPDSRNWATLAAFVGPIAGYPYP